MALGNTQTGLMNAVVTLEQKCQKAIAEGKEPKPIDTSRRKENTDQGQPLSRAEWLVPLKECPTMNRFTGRNKNLSHPRGMESSCHEVLSRSREEARLLIPLQLLGHARRATF